VSEFIDRRYKLFDRPACGGARRRPPER